MAESSSALPGPDPTKYYDRRAELYRRAFTAALPYDEYVQTGKDVHQARWRDVLGQTALSPAQAALVASLGRPLNLLVVSGTWCGDCIRQVPILKRIADASSSTTLRIIDRDAIPELRDEVRLCGASRVPVALFLTPEFFECARVGDRPLATYRMMARTQLGPACPVGIGGVDRDEMDAALSYWVDEFERVQLMLRLAPYMRDRYQD